MNAAVAYVYATVGFFERQRKLAWFCLLAAMAAIGITIWSYEDTEPRGV